MNKKCSRCDIEYPESHFRSGRRVCKKCRTELAKEKRKKKLEQRELDIANGKKKECVSCKEEKSYADFALGNTKCKICKNKVEARQKIERNKKKLEKRNENSNETKKCSICSKNHPISYYRVDSNQCKDCRNKKRREKRAASKKPETKPSDVNNKICKYCKKEQPENNFRKNRRKCRDCERADGRKFRQSDRGKEKSKAWVENNKDKMKELQSKFYQKNKDKINANYREKYKNNPEFKYKVLAKACLQHAIKAKNPSKNGRKTDYLGCNRFKIQEWMEFCFDDNMTFENYGNFWHADHVIPVNTFDLKDDNNKRLCFSWYNTSPLEGVDNMEKKDKIDKKQLKTHLKNLKKYGFEIPEDYKQLCKKHLQNTTTNNIISNEML